LIYALECENIAITGKGTLEPKMDLWRTWFPRPKAHLNALKELYDMAYKNVPVEQRQMAKGENHLRPHLIQFNRCKNVLLDGFKIRESPFWTIHMYMCENGIARNLDVKAHGHNNDGIDIEMTRNFLVENCLFDQGDDAVVIKAGRNYDAWRLNTPTENIVIRNCTIVRAHVLLGIGSEMSAGVRNVYMHNCNTTANVLNMFYIKTNHRHGGFVENIYMDRVECASTGSVLGIDTDVLYQWRDLVPTYDIRISKINGIYMSNVKCETADNVYDLKGDIRNPITDVIIKNVSVNKIREFYNRVLNVRNLKEENVTYKEIENLQ
jgi:polygalacturonase